MKCGQIDRYEPDTEFNNFHENMYKFTRKSVYYIIKVIFSVTKKCQLTTKNKQKVLERFELIGMITSEMINSTHNKIKYMSMPLTELSKRSSTCFFSSHLSEEEVSSVLNYTCKIRPPKGRRNDQLAYYNFY